MNLFPCPLVVLRYPLTLESDGVTMPLSAVPLSVAWRNGHIDLWAASWTADTLMRVHRLLIVGTGHTIIEGAGRFVGTVVDPEDFVWHIFWQGVEP